MWLVDAKWLQYCRSPSPIPPGETHPAGVFYLEIHLGGQDIGWLIVD